MNALSKTYSKASAVSAGVALLLASIVGIAAVSAQSGPTQDCAGDSVVGFGDQFFGLDDFGNRLLSTEPSSRQFALPTALPAGDYAISAVSYDGYPERQSIAPQQQEQWFAEFLAADGSVLATSGTTADIEDSIEEALWTGDIGSVSLSAEATQVRIVHAAPGSVSVNSVRPVCLGISGDAIAPVDTGPAESSVTVDYDSDSSATSSIEIVCGEDRESATGDTIDLTLPGVAAGETCTVSYAEAFDCTVVVDPTSVAGDSSAGEQVIVVPDDGGANITIDIDCSDPQIAAATSTTVAPVVTTTPTTTAAVVTTTTISTEVQAQTETTAPASAQTATAQDGQPAFTG